MLPLIGRRPCRPFGATDKHRVCALRGGATRCCEAKAQSDGTDAVAAMLSLIDRRRWFALHIFAHKRFLEVPICKIDNYKKKWYNKRRANEKRLLQISSGYEDYLVSR